MQIKSQKDFFSGVLFMGIGGAFAWGATTYTVGTAAHMGPGYFPLMLGLLMVLLGMLITFKSLVTETESGDHIGHWAWRPLFFILAANVAFGVLLGGLPRIGLPPMGLIAAIVALALIAALAGKGFVLRDVLLLAALLAVGSYLIFIVLLKLQIPVWPAFVGA
jgi:hypothetical protein